MYLAVDVGGTKTLLASFTEAGKITESFKFPTPKDYDEFVKELEMNIKNLKTTDFLAACVAIPGRVDRKHGIGIAFGNLSWENIPIQEDLERITHCPVFVENDANLAGLSEALLLTDTYKKALYVTISTGIGGIFVVNGKMDPNTLDAEIGHTLLEHDDKLMRWQEFASGKAIVAKYGKKASEIEDPRTWYVIARNIALGLINMIATLTPDVIILGGGVGTHLPKFKDRLEEHLQIYANPMITIPPIVQAQRPEEAVVYGCYQICKAHRERIR